MNMQRIIGPVLLALLLAACGPPGAEYSVPTMQVTPATGIQPYQPEAATGALAATPAPAEAGPAAEQRYPEILDASLEPAGDGTYSVAVTISSPYDSPQRYADGWRVLAPDGTVLAEHTLLHDHADEQPFTRTQRGVAIPAGIDSVTIEGRDSSFGYGGPTVTVEVPPGG